MTVRSFKTTPTGPSPFPLTASSRDVSRLLSEVRVSSTFSTTEPIRSSPLGISTNIEETTGALRDPTGLVKTLLDPKGSIATLLDDDNLLFDQIVQAVEELVAILAQFSEFSEFVNTTQPQISGLLEKGRITLDKGNDVLEAVKNNPFLRGGVPERKEQQTTFQSYRDEDF
ncbi:hypothetical protein ES703_121604 [subsurface metagenome]